MMEFPSATKPGSWLLGALNNETFPPVVRLSTLCRLIKSIYGLKHALREWNMELNYAIVKYGLKRSQHDQCLYFRRQGEEWMVALFFVDNAMVCGTNRKAPEDFVSYLGKKFELRTLPTGRFLGLTIKRDRSR